MDGVRCVAWCTSDIGEKLKVQCKSLVWLLLRGFRNLALSTGYVVREREREKWERGEKVERTQNIYLAPSTFRK